ncbi:MULTISPECIES: GntP family permease [unclassified Modestobacter]|uniref:GntP family permease n=1 Tax=unclassified Modestobacter TaxID=2643866 RepID=UPI0022AA078E|nr:MULTISPECIES: SLC13 family permease [unclassified Modestobacter]MCZ2810361.1 SLC13 family permease [Modestobacter sp. VKM Ac-2979]MCZ2841847.1 SLC13 family permease [Modestobacter sp. VKM Ac-2980]MCZ2850438.1 SLC13 family permease [Modestobacter sp. VKM Ac-2978]
MVVAHTAIAIAVIVLLIIKAKVDPVISLIIGSLYLGLATGVGFAATLVAIATGFGEIMAEVGLLIGFGVLIGALLHAVGAFRKMVALLVSRVGAQRLPYALTAAMSTVFPSIYVDVQVVLASPVARSTAPFIGRTGLPLMAGALGAGIFAGYVFVIPGLAAISIAGLLDVPLGTWLVYGFVLGPLTAIVTTIVLRLLLRGRYWNSATDEQVDEAMAEQESAELVEEERSTPPLLVSLLPILVPLVLIAFGAFAELLEFSNDFIAFLGDANFALFLGLVGAYVLCRRTLGSAGTETAMSEGFHTTGAILLITGIGGSLGAVIGETGLDTILAGLFAADAAAPVVLSILLAWLIAAVLHLAIGSVSVAAIAAAGIIGPVLGSIDVAPIVIGLAIASGAMFALQVNSNFFWMYKSLLGLSTQGTFKTLTMGTSIASVVSLPMVMAVALIA